VTEPFTYRAKCECGARLETVVPESEPVSCPICHAVRAAVAEPVDEAWWRWFILQPLNRKMLGLPPVYSPPPTAPVKPAPPAPKRGRLPEEVASRAF